MIFPKLLFQSTHLPSGSSAHCNFLFTILSLNTPDNAPYSSNTYVVCALSNFSFTPHPQQKNKLSLLWFSQRSCVLTGASTIPAGQTKQESLGVDFSFFSQQFSLACVAPNFHHTCRNLLYFSPLLCFIEISQKSESQRGHGSHQFDYKRMFSYKRLLSLRSQASPFLSSFRNT